MVRAIKLEEKVEIPEGIEVSIEDKRVKVKGPLGEVSKDFSHIHDIVIIKDGNTLRLEIWFPNRKGEAVIGTVASHIRNMMTGVQRGFRYKMKIVYAHFPMSVKVDKEKGTVLIENFLGSKDRRYAKIMPGAEVKVSKDEV
ncbi:MAG: 50S ribosomal protein L6, partial [Thermoprotei archaeon]